MNKNQNQTTPNLVIKSKVKAGKSSVNHNERPSLVIKSKVKAGRSSVNHNEPTK